MPIASAMHIVKANRPRPPLQTYKYTPIAKSDPEKLSCTITYYPYKYPKIEIEDEDLRLFATLWNCFFCCFDKIPVPTTIKIEIPKNIQKRDLLEIIKLDVLQNCSTNTDPIDANKLRIKNKYYQDLNEQYIHEESDIVFLVWKE